MTEKEDLVWRHPLRTTTFNAVVVAAAGLLVLGLFGVLAPNDRRNEIDAELSPPSEQRQAPERQTQPAPTPGPVPKSTPPAANVEASRTAETAEVLRLGTFATQLAGTAGSGRSEMRVYLAETQSYLIVRVVAINGYKPYVIVDINRNKREDYGIDFRYTDWGDRDSPSIRAMYTIGIDAYALRNYGYRREISTSGFVTGVRYGRRQLERWTEEYVFVIPKQEAALDGTNVSLWVSGGSALNGAKIRPALFQYRFAAPIDGRNLDEFLRHHHSGRGMMYTGPKLD